MTTPDRLDNEYWTPTGTSTDKPHSEGSTATSAKCEVVDLDDFVEKEDEIPSKFHSLKDVIRESETDPEYRAELNSARKKLARTIYARETETLRTLRLKQGWSQSELAIRASTSQPHIARIEMGHNDIRLSTCIRLCEVFDIDLNTLGAALKKQKELSKINSK